MTAIEWLINELDLSNDGLTMRVINKAKEMEKQQIIDAYEEGTYHNTFGNENYETSEEYYKHTFNK